mmetsp:Transcript_76970/g.120298  ORF Transcript_76970/g.120298 Transcript_76970/m.120298 type:complete len:963 (+) Transcript_76970:85-2973(+)|eukprot:CAMPEP_0169204100 /NCGR_PEP_ID=MMETSP1016-20121227/11812_1 /TAXON_ID=342587 /ORGANISM="Karlodinium micrum, Strain CCMP2283" /LENGTH=962 /DNA_ID=CAMNT_0009281173 /DNA_START=81 /DNA_END=2969 /DNA_ORIENTATION=-
MSSDTLNLKGLLKRSDSFQSTADGNHIHRGRVLSPTGTVIGLVEPPTRCTERRRAVQKVFRRICKKFCDSKLFATISTLLTIYALFGDDMRLLFTSKPADDIFDIVTIVAMSVFGLEIIFFSGGKPDYLFGFFFWLDIISTVTLVLDITTINEELFGDSISKASDNAGSPSGDAGDSAEAARAARMSRAGTKAGRVVRLIRLLRLMKMLKVFSKKDASNQYHNYPGDDWDEDDDEEHNVQESAVSKKLSEMTTRRVIILVLTIMLSLPFFKPDFFLNILDTTGQYGMNVLYRRWSDDMSKFQPELSAANQQLYMSSDDRKVYEDMFLLYIYKHNWFAKHADVPSDLISPMDSFNRLFWLGVTPTTNSKGEFMFPSLSNYDWNARWNNPSWDFYTGDIPLQAQQLLSTPWNDMQICVSNSYRGISFIAEEPDHIKCPEELRYQERAIVDPQWLTVAEAEDLQFRFVFDRRDGSQFEALLNTLQTLFVCLLLGIGSMTFSNDANTLVLAPIERMISKLDRIRNNPLEALKIGEEEHKREQVRAAKVSVRSSATEGNRKYLRGFYRCCPCCLRLYRLCPSRKKVHVPEPMETQVLERTIIKIGSLLALGFGEAGAQIIGQNMKDNDSAAVMGMIPGRKVEAIYAFCDIQDFVDATEVLQDEVMVFVNRIAAIVHSSADEYFGNPNKNVGEAFLLVWRLSGQPETKQKRLADMSLFSLIRIITKLNTSGDLAEYRTNTRLCRRIPGFRIRMSFGLHLGWAIEGAIGSEFKIDASYLSPHVNMAARLEFETKYYGAHILLSDACRCSFTGALADECRLIDCVDLGTGEPFKIYTMDLDPMALEMEKPKPAAITKRQIFQLKWERQKRKMERWSDDYNLHALFQHDQNLKAMRAKFTEEFFCHFHMAYLNYEAGNWPIAKTMLEKTKVQLVTEDGASAALLRLLEKYGGVAPASWKGYRRFGDDAPIA